MPASACASPGDTEPRGFLSFRHERHLAPSASANAYLCPCATAFLSHRLFARRRATAKRTVGPGWKEITYGMAMAKGLSGEERF
jgi:hypothetical protein